MAVPGKLFVNLYPKGVGPSVGCAYETKALADAYACTNRTACLELSAYVATADFGDMPTVCLDEETFLAIMNIAVRKKVGAGKVIKALFKLYEAIPNDVRAELYKYAAQHDINFGTAVAEACRAYVGADK